MTSKYDLVVRDENTFNFSCATIAIGYVLQSFIATGTRSLRVRIVSALNLNVVDKLLVLLMVVTEGGP